MISARGIAETALEWSGITRWAARRRRGRTLVLAYHNIVPDDVELGGDQSLHLPRARFVRQLDALTDLCDVVPLTAILADPFANARPRVAITFDDAYHGALTLGAAELQARRLPATMFVTPGLLGGQSFWWDALAGPTGLADAVRQHALGALRGDGDAVVEWAIRSGLAVRQVSPWERSGTEAEVKSWADTQSLTVGAHTWRHSNLVRLSEPELREELTRPLVWLQSRLANVVPWLTYPYGHTSSAVASAARTAGYEAALAVAGGWIARPRGDVYRLPRLNIPRDVTTRGFRLRLAGLVGNGVA